MRSDRDQPRFDPPDERPPIESRVIEEREYQPEGEGVHNADEIVTDEQLLDPTGENGPPYERDQGGPRARAGGSVDPNDALSHADTGRPKRDG